MIDLHEGNFVLNNPVLIILISNHLLAFGYLPYGLKTLWDHPYISIHYREALSTFISRWQQTKDPTFVLHSWVFMLNKIKCLIPDVIALSGQ